MQVPLVFVQTVIKMMKITYMILVLLMTLLACSRDTADIKQVKGTIIRYNQLLAEGYTKMNMNPMQEVATEEQATKVYYHMAALGEAKVRLESEVKEIEFLDIQSIDIQNVAVRTRETWDFRHVNYETLQIGLQEKGFIYTLKYELTKKGDRWLVSRVTALGEEKGPGKGSKSRKEGAQ